MASVGILQQSLESCAKFAVYGLPMHFTSSCQHIFEANIEQKDRKNEKTEGGTKPEGQRPPLADWQFCRGTAH